MGAQNWFHGSVLGFAVPVGKHDVGHNYGPILDPFLEPKMVQKMEPTLVSVLPGKRNKSWSGYCFLDCFFEAALFWTFAFLAPKFIGNAWNCKAHFLFNPIIYLLKPALCFSECN